MFIPGQLWDVTRENNQPLIVNGNTGQTVMPALNGKETRKVLKAKSELVWARAGQRNVYTQWPKASEVLEARYPDYLKFRYGNGTVITCERITDLQRLAQKAGAQ